MAGNTRKYKIRISPERTLGPLDLDRIEQLVKKGRITGKEETSPEPFAAWASFVSYPELGELLLRKLESDRGVANPKQESGPGEVEEQVPATKTMVNPNTVASPRERGEQQTGSFGIPTLINLPAAKKEDDPDTERTIVNMMVPRQETLPEPEEGTRILKPESVDLVLQQYSPVATTSGKSSAPAAGKKNLFGGTVDSREYVTETGKRRLMSRNTAALLALGLMLIAYLTTQQEEAADPKNIAPKYHTFPYVEVNVPPQLGNVLDRTRSAELMEAGALLAAKETPSAYIQAIKKHFYPAVGRNTRNYDARAQLASAYIRISEIVPRDKRLFETVEKLLFPGPPRAQWTPEYVVAVAEYYQMLNRFDQAQEEVDNYLNRRQTPELLFQKAKISFERREIDKALNSLSKAILPANVSKANPRHLLFYATLLDRKGQKDAAAQNLNRLYKEAPLFGPGLLYHADFLLRNGKAKEARLKLKILLDRPHLLDRVHLAEAFSVAARTLEALNEFPRARAFAEAAESFHYDQESVRDVLYRIKSRIKATSGPYTQIVAGRQKEKAKQLDQAMIQYVRALEMNRRDPVPFLLMGRLFEEKGDINEALDRYGKALKGTASRPVEAYLAQAKIFAQRFELEKAKNTIKMASELKRRTDQVDYLRGLVNIQAKRKELAMPYLEKAVQRGSRLTDLYIQLGDLEVEEKNQKLAEFYYSTALRYEAFHPKAMLGVALTRFHLDSPTRAVSFLKDKLATQPNSAAIMTNLAIIYLRSGDQDAGKNYLQNAIRSDSRYAEAFRLLGDLTKDEGNRQTENYAARRHSYRYALASYEMYSKLAPNDPEGYKATGDLYFDIRDLGAAAKNYYKVLSLTKNYPEVNLRLAQISRNGGDGEKAMALLNEEIRVNPRSDAARVEKGNIYMAQKDFTAATNAFTEAARINDKNADALFGLGVVHHLQGSYDNALSLFSRVIKLDPLKADVYWQMGLIYQKQNNRAKAVQAFTNFKGLTRDPASLGRADDKIREMER
jgi:tetratricopeptide (TPR) repeat protein